MHTYSHKFSTKKDKFMQQLGSPQQMSGQVLLVTLHSKFTSWQQSIGHSSAFSLWSHRPSPQNPCDEDLQEKQIVMYHVMILMRQGKIVLRLLLLCQIFPNRFTLDCTLTCCAANHAGKKVKSWGHFFLIVIMIYQWSSSM